MNRTVVISFGLIMLLHGAINQTEATAQFGNSSRRNLIHRVAADTSIVPRIGRQLEESEETQIANPSPELGSEQNNEQTNVEDLSPRALLDLSTTGRVPKQIDPEDAIAGVDQLTTRSLKAVEIKGDQFYHRTIPFEEPLHERFGISHPPAVQLTKSTLGFFGKSLFLPVNLLPHRHHQRDCDSNQGWRETQGRRVCPQCE